MLKLLIATRNEGKIQSLLRYCGDCGLELVTLKDFPDLGDVPETGETYVENSRLKAKTYYELTGLPALSDDAGLEIEALSGAPGIKSRRWRDGVTEMTDWEIVDYALECLRGVPPEKRTARLVAALSFYNGRQYFTATAFTDGFITDERPEKITIPGYPFREIFRLKSCGKLYSELTPEEHEKYSHRKDALMRLLPIIKNRLL